MAPAAKRRKKEIQRFPCHTCLTDRMSSQFPEYNPTETCKHLINTCKRCLQAWIETQMEMAVFTPHIQCPQCLENMKSSDVEMAVTKKMFARFVELERKWMEENEPGWRWCLNPKCKAGQVHDSGKAEENEDAAPEEENAQSKSKSKLGSLFNATIRRHAIAESKEEEQKEQKTKQEPEPEVERESKPAEPDICTCQDCGAKACVPCDRPWHDNETCEQYQARVNNEKRMAEEDASLAVIQSKTKKCPQCAKSIEKDGGCPHMFCTQCRSEFCWNCMQLINRNGQYCGCHAGIPGH